MSGGFVRRYDTGTGVDGLPGGEGAFVPCTAGWPTVSRCRGATPRRGSCSNAC